MFITFRTLDALSNDDLKEILKRLKLPRYRNYFKNKSAVANADELSEYEGKIKLKPILAYIRKRRNMEKEINSLMNIQPGLFNTPQQLSHEERKALYEALPKTNIYNTPKQLSHEEREALYEALPKAGVYNTKQKLSHDERKARFDKVSKAALQIKKAKRIVKSFSTNKPLSNIIEFNLEEFDEDNRKYFNENIGSVIIDLIHALRDGQQWICSYYYDDKVKTKMFYESTAHDLLHQLKSENFINEVEAENSNIVEGNYDFFMTDIHKLSKITFIEVSAEPNLEMSDLKRGKSKSKSKSKSKKQTLEEKLKNDKVYQALVATNAEQDVLDEYVKKMYKPKKQYKTKDGKFWKWLLTIPLNLERYQIFNALNKETAELMFRDN